MERDRMNHETYTMGITAQVIDSFSFCMCTKASVHWIHRLLTKLGNFDGLS